MPVEPEPSRWRFRSPDGAPDDLIAVGADLEPGTILHAYRIGMFPMPVARRKLGWWSPNPRGILPLDGLTVSTSLRRSIRRFEIRYDTAFETVMRRCGDPRRPHGWITEEFVRAYVQLHQLGWAHSVEAWVEDRLVGGLYGIAIGGLFAGESMFHEATDASKVALVALVDRLNRQGFGLLDVQWKTDHLASLGVVEMDRRSYLIRLDAALEQGDGW